jgi:RND family efflux transporter MFP subunit
MTLAKLRCRVLPLAICVLAGSACRGQTAEEVDSTTAVAVKTAPATLGTIRGVVHATGIVSPAPGAELVIVAPEAARIAAIPHAGGDSVRQGDVLVRFEIPSATAEVQKQQAEVARAEATLNNAKAAQTRARDLFERGVAARREVEDANRSVADAEAAVAGARASLGAARTVAGRADVRATFNGIIARRYHNPGDLVAPNADDPVLRVIDPRRVEVVASVPLADVSRVEVGAPGHLMNASTNTPDVGLKVLSRPAAVEAGTATVPVRLAFEGPVNIPIGAPVQIDIEAEQHRDVVLIPAAAIVREGEETAAFVATGKTAERRPVRIGLADGTNVEIVSGIKTGEKVIVDGQAGLPDHAAITEGSAPKESSDVPASKDGPK